jgi:hypothetical protein
MALICARQSVGVKPRRRGRRIVPAMVVYLQPGADSLSAAQIATLCATNLIFLDRDLRRRLWRENKD